MSLATMNRWFMDHPTMGKAFLVIVFVLPLVLLFGIGGVDAGCGLNQGGAVGKLGDRVITQDDIEQQFFSFDLWYRVNYNQGFTTSSQSVISAVSDYLFRRLRVLREAEALGIDEVTPEEFTSYITSHRGLQSPSDPNNARSPGVYDESRFNQLRDFFMSQRGLKGNEFDELWKQNIIIDRMENRITQSVAVTPTELQLNFLRSGSQVEGQIQRFNSGDHLIDIEVTDEEVEAYFNENMEERYMTPPQTRLQVVAFKIADFARDAGFTPTEEEMRAAYDEYKDDYFAKRQHHLRHILFTVNLPDSEEVMKEKRDELTTLLASIRDQENFEEMAKLHSDDFETKDKGGDLGFVDETFLESEVRNAARKLEVGEISDVLTTKRGFQVIQKIEERQYLPYEDSLDELIETMELRAHYEKNKDKYQSQELKGRRILKLVKKDATPEEKQEIREGLEKILADVRADGKLFHRNARFKSDGPNAFKGGLLDWFPVGSFQKEVEDTLVSLKDDEISDIFESAEGLNIVQRLGVREFKPFREIRDEISRTKSLDGENTARTQALEAAYAFVDGFQDATDNEEDGLAISKVFQQHCSIPGRGKLCVSSGFFSDTAAVIPEVPGDGIELIEAGAKCSQNRPYTGVVAGDDYVYMGCWLESAPTTPSSLKEETADGDVMVLSKMGRQAKTDLQAAKALDAAREAARGVHADLAERIAAGASFAEAAEAAEADFTETTFPLSRGPDPIGADDDTPTVVKDLAEESPNDTLAAPKDTAKGAVIIYVAKHFYPENRSFSSNRGIMMYQYINRRQNAAIEGFYADLAEKYELLLPVGSFLQDNPDALTTSGGSGGGNQNGSGRRNRDGSGG